MYVLTTFGGAQFQGKDITEVVEKWSKAKHSLYECYEDVKIKSISIVPKGGIDFRTFVNIEDPKPVLQPELTVPQVKDCVNKNPGTWDIYPEKEKSKVETRPYTPKEACSRLVGMKISRKGVRKNICLVLGVTSTGMVDVGTHKDLSTLKYIHTNYEFVGGAPCGMPVKPEPKEEEKEEEETSPEALKDFHMARAIAHFLYWSSWLTTKDIQDVVIKRRTGVDIKMGLMNFKHLEEALTEAYPEWRSWNPNYTK